MSGAAEWAARIRAMSEAHPIAPAGAAFSGEPAHAEAILARLASEAAAAGAQPLPAPGTIAPASGLAAMGIGGLLASYRDGSRTPPEVVAALLDRSGPGGPAPEATLSAIAGAEALATDSEKRIRRGTARPLEGIPFGIKDIIDVAGARVTCGSHQTGDRHADADATVVARLRAAGAIPLLMLASSEFACGAPANARYGAVPNPWDRTRWTGGSSTGSAAALAARIVPLALGTDTGGSIRIPAAFCGVTGLKPTRGLVPRTGVATLSWTLDHVGPMARSCADIAAVLPIVAGPDGQDPLAACAVPPAPLRQSLAGLRIGVPSGWFVERCDSAVLAAWRLALDVLRDAGAMLAPVELPEAALAHEEAWSILYAELASCQESRFSTMHLFDAGTRDRIDRGRAMAATDYLRALRRRPLVMEAVLRAMAGVDILVTPGGGAEAPTLSDLAASVDGEPVPVGEIASRNTMLFDYTGLPALMLPAGRGACGLPVGVQIVGKPFEDALCVSAGAMFQARTAYHLAAP